MRTVLGLLLVFTLNVSGGDKTVTGFLGESALLPCSCTERDLDEEFKWQQEEPNKRLVLKHNNSNTDFSGTYGGRAKIFLSENSSDCSVLLTNIAANDQGKYRCKFRRKGRYQKPFVNLIIYGRYNVCQWNPASNQNGTLSEKVFQCHATGSYRDAEIQWNLDEELLTNSTTTKITNTVTLDGHTGHYNFTSKLITKLNGISKPRCNVTAKGISTTISEDCKSKIDMFQQKQHRPRYRYFKIIPIMMVLGFSLVLGLWHRWKFSQRQPPKQDVEAAILKC